MSVKFFGQYLIEQGEINAEQLCEALDMMESENKTLGEMAVEAGFASSEEVRRVNGAQRRRDMKFGELALQMGVLNSIELDELLQQQQAERLKLEDALVHLGHVPAKRIFALLADFETDQAAHRQADPSNLPEGLQGNRLAALCVDLFPRYCMRVGRIEAKLSLPTALSDAPDLPMVASLAIAGSHGVDISLAAEASFAEKLATGVSGLDLSAMPDMAAELSIDALGEYLNVLAGNVVAAVEGDGFECRVEPPQFGVLPSDGYCFDVASNSGRACLVIAARPAARSGAD